MVPKDFPFHVFSRKPIRRDKVFVMWCAQPPTNDCDTGCSQVTF